MNDSATRTTTKASASGARSVGPGGSDSNSSRTRASIRDWTGDSAVVRMRRARAGSRCRNARNHGSSMSIATYARSTFAARCGVPGGWAARQAGHASDSVVSHRASATTRSRGPTRRKIVLRSTPTSAAILPKSTGSPAMSAWRAARTTAALV